MQDDYREQRFQQYSRWQDRVLSIGKDVRARGQFIDDKKRKLQEEHIELIQAMDSYFLTHPDRTDVRERYKGKFIEESGDFINIAGIVLGTIDNSLPFYAMISQLLLHHEYYGTNAAVDFDHRRRASYTPRELFESWEMEIININRVNKQRIKDIGSTPRQRINLALENFRYGIVEKIDESLERMPKSHEGYLALVGESEFTDPSFRFRLAVGDAVNDCVILLGLFDVTLPFDKMYEKLVLREEDYRTGRRK